MKAKNLKEWVNSLHDESEVESIVCESEDDSPGIMVTLPNDKSDKNKYIIL